MNEDWIKCQIAELEKLLEMCKDSEIMRLSITARIEDFKEQLNHFQPKSVMSMIEFENWRASTSYRLIGWRNGDKFELSSNIPTIELADRVRKDVVGLYPFFDNVTIEEYSTYQL